MALLDQSTETLTIYPGKLGTDADGNERFLPWQDGDPTYTLSNAHVQPNASNVIVVNGEQFDNEYRVIVRSLPAGAPSFKLARVDWNGRTFDIYQEPFQYSRGRSVRHVSFTMRERS